MKYRTLVLVLLGYPAIPPAHASAQAVGFIPTIGNFQNGVMLNTTPVVSADRRYVRLGVDFQASVLQGFNTISVPAAVGGGTLGGIGGAGGGGGGGGAARLLGGLQGGGFNGQGAAAGGNGRGGFGSMGLGPRERLQELAEVGPSKAKGRALSLDVDSDTDAPAKPQAKKRSQAAEILLGP